MGTKSVKYAEDVVGLHDSRCARHKGHTCNCASAAFIKKGKSCGHRLCMKYNRQCPSCGRINGKDRNELGR